MNLRRACLGILGICLCLLFLPWHRAISARATPLTLVGNILNGTHGAGLPPGPSALVATAVQLNESGAEADRRSSEAAADGSFRLEGFDAERGKRFVVGTDYLGVTYSQLVEFKEGESELRADLKIHEQTDDETVLRVLRDILTIVEGDEGTFEIIQLMRVENNSDRTFVGRVPPRESQNAAVLTFPVPQGSFDVTPLEGLTSERMAPAPQGFTAGDPVLPGETKYSYLYKVRVPRGGWDLQRAVIYGTARSDILVGEGLEVVSDEFEFEERTKVGGKFYRRYQGGAWEAGATWPASIRREGGSQPGIWIGAGLGLAVLGAAGAGSIFARRRKQVASGARGETRRSPRERERLVEEIAKLDVRFENGDIEKGEYERKRQTLKRKLADITETM